MKKQILVSIVLLGACSTDVFALRGGSASQPSSQPSSKPSLKPSTAGAIKADPAVVAQGIAGLQAKVQSGTYAAADVAAGAAAVAGAMGGNANSVAGLTTQAILNA